MRFALTSTLLFVVLAFALVSSSSAQDPFYDKYVQNCATCHGYGFEGTGRGPSLLTDSLKQGDSLAKLTKTITLGVPETTMPGFAETLDTTTVRRIAILISEVRMTGVKLSDFYNVRQSFEVPAEPVPSEEVTFRLETVARGLDPLPYSIAPLPDGRLLVTEKMRGLRVVSTDGTVSDLITGTPKTYDDAFQADGIFLKYGLGWMLDVALHPDYEENGWIYMSHGDRCSDCNYMSRTSGADVSMARLIRGRIKDGAWVDEQIIWQADSLTYSPNPDMTLGGRIAFDHQGHLFLSVGMKGLTNFMGVQDLKQPHGKILRLNEDGSIPPDNPYVGNPDALDVIWSYGHRSPQGLEYHRPSGQLWETEMGPRGGDEVNLIEPGNNYGWPLYSKGLDYDGTPVEYWKQLGVELDLSTIEQPKVDLTPSPAVSSFIFYDGDVFPEWQDQIIVGTLKATELYRMVVQDGEVVHQEKLLDNLARIRDIEVGPEGAIYLLLEHASGGQIVRMVRD